ncbi:winged helix-turn-helix domain-containing protein [Methanococcus maripaludis]|uniref:DNA-binding transcriptional ArsR family regulator n=1 Tax=Methanococcus maripaludis TaxID=39152 RepID=A0A8T4H9C6_METMI|nr:winged helix-turn-helix domain-containing protein [Methanococcus maripaludis]MBM7408623.1 DNA-binding transcriptional ArsR family regulator [Methanococcus maripaludis]MBP2219858.1 DNA-binding transcriptional ArsR family regulator [Methanococcus maripaludis]
MTGLEVNKKFLKALSSRSRISILKALGNKNYTVTELSKSLKLSKSTVHEHLSILVDGELVKKNEDGRKWVYYGLTEKGQYLIMNDLEKMIILFPMSVIVFLSGLYSILFLKLGSRMVPRELNVYSASALKSAESDAVAFGISETATTVGSDLNLLIGAGLILISLLIAYHVISKITYKSN